MEPVFKHLLVMMVVVWTVAVMLRKAGLPTVMGELVMGVILGPAVLGWVHPSEIIEILAQMGIFFLMLHTGVNTKPHEFFAALRLSLGVAFVGALVPFSVSMGIAVVFGYSFVNSLFIGLTMTATAVVVTLKILHDLGLRDTRMAHVIVASCIIDDLLTLLMFSVLLSILKEGTFEPYSLLLVGAKSVLFFALMIAIGHWLYPLFKHPFRTRGGKGFTFLLMLGLACGLLAEAIGLHIIIGAYLAGLFFREEVVSEELLQKVEDRLNAIAYSFLGPIFFISLGFHITFDALTGQSLLLMISLTSVCAIGQIISAGGMARRINFSYIESLTVGVGMCGRAEMAFVLASLGLSLGAIDEKIFSVLIFTTFTLNILTSVGLKGCSLLLQRQAEEKG